MKCNDIGYTKAEIVNVEFEGGSALKKMVDTVVEELCKCSAFLKTVMSYVLNHQGNIQDAEDVIQEGLAQLVVNLYENKYQGQSSIENYAFGICKFKWNNRRRKVSRLQYMNDEKWTFLDRKADAAQNARPTEDEEMIWKIIGQMNQTCKNLLKLVYKGLSYKQIGEELNFAEQTVKNKVSACRKKLHTYLESHPGLKIYFTQ